MKRSNLDSIPLGFDVVVVGAGTAGCTVANNLKENMSVLLVDQKEFPRKKACSGILVSESIDFLRDDQLNNFLITTNKLDIEYIDLDNNTKKLVKKGFFNSNRFLLDRYLFNKLELKENTYFLENARLIEYNYTQDKKHIVLLIESKGVIKPIITKYLIGCDGALSIVRKKIFKKEIPFYIGVQEIIKTSKQFDHAFFIFDSEITDFYSWIIPKPPYIEIGTLLDPFDSKDKYKKFKEKLSTKFGLNENGKIDSAIVLRPDSINDIFLGDKNVMLCGEAAGLISPSSAEGISYALRSGESCAKAINSKKENIYEEYANNCKELVERLKKKFEKSKIISDKTKRKKMFS